MKKNAYKNRYKWAISTICRGDSDILEMFIMYYYKKVDILTIGLHKPSQRVIDLIKSIVDKNNIKNLNIFYFNSSIFSQRVWTNDIYKNIMKKNKGIDIYAHIDLDEFIYRFDLIEDSFKPNRIIKVPWLEIIRDNKEKKYMYTTRDPLAQLPEEALSHLDKTFYCIGADYNKMEYSNGGHDIIINGKNNDERDIVHLNYSCFYHLLFRNDIQTYSKISNLLIGFNDRGTSIDNIWGAHVFKRFLNTYSPDHMEKFHNLIDGDFNINIDEFSFEIFAKYGSSNTYSDSGKIFKVNPNFYEEYFLKYYKEEFSLLDFVEQDFLNKMNSWKNNFNNNYK